MKISTFFGVERCMVDLIAEELPAHIATHNNASYFMTNNIKLLQYLEKVQSNVA